MTELLTPQEAAHRLRVSPRTVQRLTSAGKLQPVYPGRYPRYTERALEACIALLEAERRRRRVA